MADGTFAASMYQFFLDSDGVGDQSGTFEASLEQMTLAAEAEDLVATFDGVMEKLTISVNGATGVAGTLAQDMPHMTLEATGVRGETGTATLTLPYLQLEAEQTGVVGTFEAAFEGLSLNAQGVKGVVGSADLTLPYLELASGEGVSLGSFEAQAQYFSLSATGVRGFVGSADLTMPTFQLLASETLINNGTTDLTLPRFVLQALGENVGGIANLVMPFFQLFSGASNDGTADLRLPYFALRAMGFEGGEINYVAVMNILNFAMSEYQHFNFNSYCAKGDIYLGADQNGIYQLYGDDDNGLFIDMEVEKTGMDFQSVHEKRPTDLYLTVYSEGDFIVEVLTEDMSQVYVENCPASDNIRTFKVIPGKGLKGRYLGFNVKNMGGADLALTQMEMLVEVLSRRAR